ncbi:stringent starvation protein B [Comamonas kerstersii]|uniref:Stringent starvation protein B n=1 Tax=Comamonas kerstersii TaxID=225992 RepID=A0A1V0BIT6_9BURK|nr:ClpXP protease specificity-enhancing factor [Comamonas kerstersii]AQZ99839.1 stringent starvation protein B [Comamonas kerstersii]
MTESSATSTRPYLIRAIHEWCTDNGFTPYLAVKVDRSVQVPREYVNGGEIVLNVSYDATGSLQLGNEYIEFKARFGGRPHDIMVPVERVQAIYARETGQGMSFPVIDDLLAELPDDAAALAAAEAEDEAAPEQEPAASTPVVQLVSASSKPSDGDEPPSPPAPAAGGKRPALKRVK